MATAAPGFAGYLRLLTGLGDAWQTPLALALDTVPEVADESFPGLRMQCHNTPRIHLQ